MKVTWLVLFAVTSACTSEGVDADDPGSATADLTSSTNLALGKPAYSSSIDQSGREAGKAVDGNSGTRWSSAYADPQWIYVDLGATYQISEVKLSWETAYGKAYQLVVSNDAANWTTIYSTTTGNGATDDLTGLSGSARYVGVYGTKRATQWGYSLYELAVYGASTSDTTPPTVSISNPATTYTSAQTVTVQAAAADNIGVTKVEFYDGTTLEGTDTSSPFSYAWAITTADNGAHEWTAKAYDAAGNTTTSAAVALTANIATGAVMPVGVGGTWTLAFDDEFNGSSLDLTKWAANWYGEGGTMNNAKTYAANVSVTGGNLVLTLASATSGALVNTQSNNGFAVTPGMYAEARISFAGNGSSLYNWPAWWISGSSWPANGEHDIAEVLGGPLTVNYHSPSGAHNTGAPSGYRGGAFHTYGIYRKASSADVYWDGVLVRSYATDDNGGGEGLIFNVGSGGVAAYGTTGQMKVDYVRVWKP